MQEVIFKVYVYKAVTVRVLHVFYLYDKNVNLLCIMIRKMSQ